MRKRKLADVRKEYRCDCPRCGAVHMVRIGPGDRYRVCGVDQFTEGPKYSVLCDACTVAAASPAIREALIRAGWRAGQ